MSSIPALAMSGMSAAQLRLQTSAHNIANLSTDGFRRQQVQQASNPLGGVRTSVTQALQPRSWLSSRPSTTSWPTWRCSAPATA
jgi:flagellar basal body rod protein FlgG